MTANITRNNSSAAVSVFPSIRAIYVDFREQQMYNIIFCLLCLSKK